MPRFSGNKGEWSELYALCKLLGQGRLYNADADLSKNESQYVEIETIQRKESDDRSLEYRLDKDNRQVLVFLNGNQIRTLPQSAFADAAELLLHILGERKGRAFEIEELDEFIDAAGITKLKPSGTDKPDISVDIFDSRTSSRYTTNYSIKSFIGAKPSLVNSSALTYFFYELVGFTDEDYETVKAIPSNKVKQRAKRCRELADDVLYSHLAPEATTFHDNLMRVHPFAEATLGNLILESYSVRGKRSRDVLHNVMENNPMDYDPPSLYEDAYRSYLWAAFFGMVPSRPWERRDSVDGYLLINNAGEALSYPVVKQNAFSDHLLDATSFDTPSTSPNRPTSDTGAVFQQDGKYYLALNLQIKYSGGKLTPDSTTGTKYASAPPHKREGAEAQRDITSDEPISRFRIIG